MGLINKWRKEFLPDYGVRKCLYGDPNYATRVDEMNTKKRINLNNLAGAFIILVVGVFASLVTFIFELVFANVSI